MNVGDALDEQVMRQRRAGGDKDRPKLGSLVAIRAPVDFKAIERRLLERHVDVRE